MLCIQLRTLSLFAGRYPSTDPSLFSLNNVKEKLAIPLQLHGAMMEGNHCNEYDND